MTDKQNDKCDDFDDFNFGSPDEIARSLEEMLDEEDSISVPTKDYDFDLKPTITEQDIKSANNMRENIKKQNTINDKEAENVSVPSDEYDFDLDDKDDFDFSIGNDETEKNIEDDEITDEDLLNTMTYYVATYAAQVEGKRTIFKRFMDISRDTDDQGNKNVKAMILFFTDLINEISGQGFRYDADEKKNEYLQIFAATIVFLAENKNWK